MEKLIKEITEQKKTCYFISPHLDDAALSAGGLISYLAQKTKVVVITVFTHAGDDNHSLSALLYARKCGYRGNSVDKLFLTRRREDKKQFEKLGVEVKYLGFLDALWRKRGKPDLLTKFLSRFINEYLYIYPTHRIHVARGVVHEGDIKNLSELKTKLRAIVDDDNAVVFSPIGIGKHVDHVVVREACNRTFNNVIYWSDYIYNLHSDPNEVFLDENNLKEYEFEKNQAQRKKMILLYKTQIGKLFGEKDFNLPVEKYYLNTNEDNGLSQ